MNRFGMLLVMLAYSSSCYSEDTVTAEDALRGYEDYFESIRSISLHSRFMDRNAEKSDHFTNTLSQKWRIDFEGRRLWRTTRKIIEDPKTEAEKKLASTYFEALVAPDAHYGISAYVDTRTAYCVLSYLETPQDYWKTDTGLGYLCYPFGYLKDGREYQYIPDMVREASKSILSEEGESSSLIVVAAKTAEYEFDISLDPSKGWFAERIEFTRTAPAEDAARPEYCLYTVEHSSNHGGVWLPDLYRCEISKEAGKHKLGGDVRVVDGKFIIVTGDSEIGTDYIERPKSTLIAEVTISDIELGSLSDSDFQLETTIPNGMEVSMQDARRLNFVWRDGEVVSLADELEALRDSEFLGGPGSPRFWAVALGVVLIALILYFAVRGRRKARTS
jgi:hypothetical protein